MISVALRARVLLEEARALGVDLADLIAAGDGCRTVPTVAEHVACIDGTFTPGTAATYRPYRRLFVELHGDRRLSDLDLADLHAVVDTAADRARRRKPDSTGRSSTETCVAALRALYRSALDAGIVTINPAAALSKPRRPRPRRRALDDDEVAQVINAVRATSIDPALDLLIVRLHLETGARRSGALAVRRDDLDQRRSTLWLTEKDSTREQPISPTLLDALVRHHAERTESSQAGLLRRRNGEPVTGRDYDRLFAGVRSVLPWARRTPVSAHVLRHTAITSIARIGGYPVAQAFAGHMPATVTGRYIHATLSEVAAAVSVLTGEPHPLGTSTNGSNRSERARCTTGRRGQPGASPR